MKAEMLTTLFDDETLSIGAVGSVFVVVYRANATVKTLIEVEKHEAAILQKFPKVSVVTLIPDVSQMLRIDDAVRAQSLKMLQRFDKDIRGSATIILARGLAGTMVRTFLIGFNLMSKAKSPGKTFAEVTPALEWLSTLSPAEPGLSGNPRLSEAILAFAMRGAARQP